MQGSQMSPPSVHQKELQLSSYITNYQDIYYNLTNMCVFSSVFSIILLILSSCYLAFRVCSLEQQLSFLSNPNLPLRER